MAERTIFDGVNREFMQGKSKDLPCTRMQAEIRARQH